MLSRWDHYPILVEGNPSGDAKGQTKIVVSSKKGLIRVILGQFDAWKGVFCWDRSVWNQVILFESQTGSDMWRQLVRVWAQKRRIRRRSRRHNSIGGQSWTLLSLLLLPDHDEEVEKFDNKCLKVESKCFGFQCTLKNHAHICISILIMGWVTSLNACIRIPILHFWVSFSHEATCVAVTFSHVSSLGDGMGHIL